MRSSQAAAEESHAQSVLWEEHSGVLVEAYVDVGIYLRGLDRSCDSMGAVGCFGCVWEGGHQLSAAEIEGEETEGLEGLGGANWVYTQRWMSLNC